MPCLQPDSALGLATPRNEPLELNGHLTRRQMLVGSACFAGAALWPVLGEAQSKTRLILLGTGGGPRPRKANSASAQAIVIADQIHVIDCGDGVARQLVSAGLSLEKLRHIFITHQHSDHTADYGNLIWLGWTAGLRTQVDAWGPPPLQRMTSLFFEMNAVDIQARMASEGRVPLVPLVRVHELTSGQRVLDDGHVRVTAAIAIHPPMVPSFAYRFDASDRSIVISGDTARSTAVTELARGADVLVHSAFYPPAVDRLVARVPNAGTLKQTIYAGQTSVEDAGRVAQAAGVRTLVLSHLIPSDDPAITDEMWIKAARGQFKGTIVVGKDLLEV
jgi:ribonuclease BN (tRNA processing enzyme)